MNSIDAIQKASLLLVQLTDSHLFAGEEGRLLGMATADSLAKVIELLRTEQPAADLLLATGDLSQDGTVQAYERFAQMTAGLAASERWCAGNHDEPAAMQQACAGSERMSPIIDLAGWRIIVLDSSVPGSVPGRLASDQLALLESALADAADRHVLITFHHHPLPVGCNWLDPIGLRNADDLFAITDRHSNLRCILWGHVHQEIDSERKGVRLLATPSTCVQFAPHSEDFLVGMEAPGYRWLQLHADGSIDSGVSRVSDIEFEIDYTVKGY